MGRIQPTAEKTRADAQQPIDKETGLRPWQPAFWEAMIGKYPGKDAAGEVGSRLTPEALWDLACLYFQGGNDDKMYTKDFIRSGDNAGMLVEVDTIRPFSWVSLDLFLLSKGIKTSINTIRKNLDNRFGEFQEVIERIGMVIYEQKFDGAAIGGYNPQLIIRDLGLADKVDASVKTEQPLFVDTPQPPVEPSGSTDPSDDLM